MDSEEWIRLRSIEEEHKQLLKELSQLKTHIYASTNLGAILDRWVE